MASQSHQCSADSGWLPLRVGAGGAPEFTLVWHIYFCIWSGEQIPFSAGFQKSKNFCLVFHFLPLFCENGTEVTLRVLFPCPAMATST